MQEGIDLFSWVLSKIFGDAILHVMCLAAFPAMLLGHSLKCLVTFPRMFGDTPQNVWGHFLECLVRYPGMFDNIPGNVCPHSPECLGTFSRVFGDIPCNVSGHSLECLVTLPRMFEDIPGNVWQHILECNIFPIPHVSRIPFPVPVFQVLYTAIQWRLIFAIVVLYFNYDFE